MRLGGGGDVGQAARVVADDADDVLAVLEGEVLADRLAVAGREGMSLALIV